MSGLEIRLFGQISVEWGGRRSPDLSAKALELLSFVLLHRDRAHTRETLAGVLWPEAPDPLSKKYLRQTLWQLQSKLASLSRHEQDAIGTALLTADAGWVRVNHQAGWWLDVAAFEQAYGLSRESAGRDLNDRQVRALESAVDLYRGDLIATWYQDWCIYERDRLQLTYLAILEKLMGHCEAAASYAKGVGYGQSILRYDPARESTHRQLMRLYYQAGDRTTALRQYDRCVAAVAEQFNVEPARETVALYQQLRTDRLDDGRHGHVEPPAATSCDEPLAHQQAKLDQLQVSLSALQRQVQQQVTMIRAIQANLTSLQLIARALTEGQETARQTTWQMVGPHS